VRTVRLLRWLREKRDGLRWTAAYLRRLDGHNAELLRASWATVAHLRVVRHPDGVTIVGTRAALINAADLLQVAALEVSSDATCAHLGALSVAILAAVHGQMRDGVRL
jgi:hypothetical protein